MKIEISNGDLIDKYTILLIKSKRVTDPAKLEIVLSELENLELGIELLKIKFPNVIGVSIDRLQDINETLWNIEDSIREKEKLQEFDQQFIVLARSVYYNNDSRAQVKQFINIVTDSPIEVKQYSNYTT